MGAHPSRATDQSVNDTILDPGSFRDRTGNVYTMNGRVFRTVTARAHDQYLAMRDGGVVAEAIEKEFLIPSEEVDPSAWPAAVETAAFVIEHQRVEFISYPYEWSFGQLKAAALHHLDFQIFLLNKGFKLSDASAYNVQFIGAKPVFIDLLSIAPYTEGEYWTAHRQFCEQFLNPLLLRALIGMPHNAWYRGALEGIPTADLARLIPLRKRFSWNVISQVLLQAKFDQSAINRPDEAVTKIKATKRFSKAAYSGFLLQLRTWIGGLHPGDTGKTVWGDYATTNTYTDVEAQSKRNFISTFAAEVKPDVLIDLGCNTGDYSLAALDGGAEYVVGFDFDQKAVDLAFARSKQHQLQFLPLWFDAANPSPDQGWQQKERRGFVHRARCDAVIALAFEHHLSIAHNVPLDQLLDWLIGLAPDGVVEFVPKQDPTVQKMLALRDDIFDDYNEHMFTTLLSERARIVRSERVSESGRILFQFSTSAA